MIERITPDGDNTYFETYGIGDPTFISKNITYNPFMCLGLPILRLSSGYPLIDICFNNESTRYLVKNHNIAVEFGVFSESFVNYNTNDISYLNYDDVVKGTASDSNIVWNKEDIDITFVPNSTATRTTSPKNLQFRYTFKNINGYYTVNDPNKYIWDKNTLDLIDIINSQEVADIHVNQLSTSNNEPKRLTVYEVPQNFDPMNGEAPFSGTKINLTSTNNNKNKNKLIIYDGKFCSIGYFRQQMGTTLHGYHQNVVDIYNTTTDSTNDTNATLPDDEDEDERKTANYFKSTNEKSDVFGESNDFRWAIFGLRYKNDTSIKPQLNDCIISLGGDDDSNNIVKRDLTHFKNMNNDYATTRKATSDVEFWIKCKTIDTIRNSGIESRWNKLTCNGGDITEPTAGVAGYYDGSTMQGAVNKPYDTEDQAYKLKSSSWIKSGRGGISTPSLTQFNDNKDIKFQFRYEKAELDEVWDIYIAIGIRNHMNVQKYINIPMTIGNSLN